MSVIKDLECDLVLRGGIASGIVYPGALVELAKSYRFRCIGGASAGAIAAAIAAAAEYGRQHDVPDAFERIVAAIPRQLGGDAGNGGMLRLLQPQPELKGLMKVMLALRPGQGRIGAVAYAMFAAFPLVAAFGTAASFALVFATGWWLGWLASRREVVALILFAAVLTGLVWVVAFMAATLWSAFRRLPRHSFGLSAGINPDLRPSAGLAELSARGGLVDWLHATIQETAGLPESSPLTMGQLWGGSGDPWAPDRTIDLLLTTTNLSQQVPHQFPFLERSAAPLYFLRTDLDLVLPRSVAAYIDCLSAGSWRGDANFRQLPRPEDMPVVLGVRLSLSFPGLIAAVRLYAPFGDVMKPCWFSDGGITSNFPISAFDNPLPSRPTFCLNLSEQTDAANRDAKACVEMADNNSEPLQPVWRADIETGGLGGFLAAIVDTARNGHENELMSTPCYRDRIVTLTLDPATEGGMNFNMTGLTIDRLDRIGREAARRLISRFAPHGVEAKAGVLMGWRNHRWLRLRVMLAGVESLLVKLGPRWRRTPTADLSYADLLAQSAPRSGRDRTPVGHRVVPSYRWADAAEHALATTQAEAIMQVAEAVTAAASPRPNKSVFDGRRNPKPSPQRIRGAPRPRAGLRFVPTTGRDPLLG